MSKKNQKRRETARRQEEQRRAKLAAASESPEADAAEVPAEDEASRIKRRAEQKREYERRKREKTSGSQSFAPFFWGGGVVSVIAVFALGGFVLLSGGGGDNGGAAAPSATPDPRIAGLPIDRTINIQTDDDGQSANPRFIPSTISAEAGEVIEIVVTNIGSVAHNLHFPGLDAEYDTRDDWLVDPPTLRPGDTGRVVVKIDDPGSNPFRCDFHALTHLGTLTLS